MLIDNNTTKDFCEFLDKEELADSKEIIDNFLTKNRSKPGSLIPVLQETQNILGYLPTVVQNYVAQGLNLAPSDVYGVVSFYSFFTMKPRGKHVIRICLGTACYVKGGNKISAAIQKQLKVEPGETTEDRQFSLELVRCVGACGLAPVVVIGEDTYGQVDPGKTSELIQPYLSSTD